MTSCRVYHQRTGFTMIEMMVVMSVFSVLLVINAKWLHQSIKFASTTKNRQRYHQNIQRLSSTLRDDVRQCRQMSVVDKNQLRLVGDQTQITTYTIEDMTIRVEKQAGDKVVFRDHFDLGPHADVQWDKSELPDWISLVVSRRPPGSVKPLTNDGSNASTPGETNNSSIRSPLNRPPPIDLHIRVGPNPWN